MPVRKRGEDVYCGACGADVPKGARFCLACGRDFSQPLDASAAVAAPPSDTSTRGSRLRRLWWLLALFAVAIIGSIVNNGGSSQSSVSDTSPQNNGKSAPTVAAMPTQAPPAYSLAVIQNGGYVNPDGLLVRQFQRQLDILSSKCNDPESTVSDQLVTTHDILHKHGIDEDYLTLLTAVDRAVPAGTSNTCAQDFAAYATIRINTP